MPTKSARILSDFQGSWTAKTVPVRLESKVKVKCVTDKPGHGSIPNFYCETMTRTSRRPQVFGVPNLHEPISATLASAVSTIPALAQVSQTKL